MLLSPIVNFCQLVHWSLPISYHNSFIAPTTRYHIVTRDGGRSILSVGN
jgi:hypothetical protein